MRLDIDPDEHDRLRKPDVALVGDAAPQLRALIAALPRHNRPRHSRAQELKAIAPGSAERLSRLEPQVSFLKAIRAALPEDGIFVDEVSQIGFASRVALPIEKPRTFLSPGYQDNLGWGFGTALGAKAAMPRQEGAGDRGRRRLHVPGGRARHRGAPQPRRRGRGVRQRRLRQREAHPAGALRQPPDRLGPAEPGFRASSPTASASRASRRTTPSSSRTRLHKAFALNAPALVWVPHGDVPSPWDMIMMPKVRR
mgnify:CR=1 FL=1